MEYTDFWERTNTLIKHLNKTQRGLALECGFTERRIETLSSNNRSPDIIEVVKIAKALNTSVEYLVTGKSQNSLANDEIQFLNNYKLLSTQNKKLLQGIISTMNNISYEIKPDADNYLMVAEPEPKYPK